jgi:pyruvate dehydrogenase E2 component (dihydrolipoamide acetyltransferase)
MISEVVMPQMGADMEEGTIIRWLKKEGDEVKRGEIIAEIETDKANVEIEAFESGVFRKVLAPEGETVSVGTVIAVIASPDEDVSRYGNGARPAQGERKAEAPPAAQETEQKAEPAAPGQVPPPEEAEAPAAGKPPEQPAPKAEGRVRASPLARKIAEERGIDLSRGRGTGPAGRVVTRDGAAAAAAGAAPAGAPPAPAEVVGMTRMRQTIARRMAQSKREAPHYYITADIDMTDAERLRHQVRETLGEDVRISVNDLIVKACALALQRHPMFNTWFVDGEVRRHDAINVCIAIALDEGLIAPAILDCAEKPLHRIAEESRSLAERARKGALKPEEYSGGTFTVSNLGMFDIETLIAIIQPPQTAILGVGSVRPQPVVRDGQIAVAQMMKAALSADHRVTDGAQGARFLNEIRRFLENPAALLVS